MNGDERQEATRAKAEKQVHRLATATGVGELRRLHALLCEAPDEVVAALSDLLDGGGAGEQNRGERAGILLDAFEMKSPIELGDIALTAVALLTPRLDREGHPGMAGWTDVENRLHRLVLELGRG